MKDKIKCDADCVWNGGYCGCQILQGPRMVGGSCVYYEKNNKDVKNKIPVVSKMENTQFNEVEIREILLRNSVVREFELKDGSKVGYRVIGMKEGEKAIKELSEVEVLNDK